MDFDVDFIANILKEKVSGENFDGITHLFVNFGMLDSTENMELLVSYAW